MALAVRNIISVDGLGNMEDEPRCDSGDRYVWDKHKTKEQIFRSLEKVAKEVGTGNISAVVIAYISHKTPYVFPVIGGPKVKQLFASIKGLEICLSPEQISYLESAVVYEPARLPDGNMFASRSPFNVTGQIGMTAASQLITDVPVDARAIAHAWLKDFIEITASGNAHHFATKLFKPDGWFRDVLVFTWDTRTLHGHGKISDYLEKKLASANITNVVLDETPELRPSPFTLPFGQGIEFSFRFETPIAFARGLARLLPMTLSGMKALSVFVMMEDLKGHKESVAETGLYGGHTITWNEVLEERRLKVENDPQVVIIGGGQSGLHAAARFKQMGIAALIVEKNQRIGRLLPDMNPWVPQFRSGDNWRKRYPSLTLHTPKLYSTTLYQPFPHNFPLFIPRDKIADWLEHYAKVQDLVVWTNSQILPKASYDAQKRRWTIQVDRDGTKVMVRPKHVVVAAGVHGFPHIPVIPHSENFRGEVLHTSQFPGGQRFARLRVVVIGAGNSSADICQDLSFRGAASVTMVQRSKTCVISSREITKNFIQAYPDDRPVEISDFKRASMPLGMVRVMAQATADQAQAVDKEMLDGLRKSGFQHYYGEDNSGVGILYISRGGGYCKCRFSDFSLKPFQCGVDLLGLDVGCAELIASGKVAIRQGVEPVSFTETGLVFNDGTELQADAVIFATGYTSWRDRMKDVFGPEVMESTKEIWGLDEEDEMCGAYRPTGYPAFWYAAGDFADSRIYSKQLALHIKAEELNLKGS
ncbi:dimethylaniline monooxygenase [Butyriboletus roseoflavus]|nr:dimethylaniline monooxygenase [Butyriboletus roseoflavus]